MEREFSCNFLAGSKYTSNRLSTTFYRVNFPLEGR